MSALPITAFLVVLVGCTPGATLRPFAGLRADASVQRGQHLLEAEELDEALAEFENAVELHPKLAVAYSGMGWVHKLKGNYEAAAQAFAEALKLDPGSFDDAFALAKTYHQLARFLDAVRAYAHACDLDPASFEARLNLGVCYHQAGELQEAIDCYTQAIAIDPGAPAGHTNLGALYEAQGKYYRAIHAYNESLERDPKQPMVLVNLATALMKQGRFRGAQKALERSIELDPELAVAYWRLGYCFFRQREYAEALKRYEWAATLDPRMPETQAGLGVVRMAMYLQNPRDVKLRSQAVEHWHRSLELKPDQPKLRLLVKKYRLPQDSPDTVLLGTP